MHRLREGSTNVKPDKLGGCSQPPALRVESTESFVLGDDHYDFVGNAEAYIGSLILGGVYTNAHGKRYIFADDGVAIFPNKKFRFGVCLDQIDPSCGGFDRFDDKSSGQIYVFRRTADTLALFKLTDVPDTEYGQPDYTHPLAVLHRVSGK